MLALSLTGMTAGCDDTPQGLGPAASSTTPIVQATSSPAACLPRVVETGYSYDGQNVHYGMIAENPCPQAAIDNGLSVAVFDATGKKVNVPGDGGDPSLFVLRPGQRLGAGGTVWNRNALQISKVEVTFTRSQQAPESLLNAWPKTVAVTDVTRSEPDGHGRTTVTGKIRPEPSNAFMCQPVAYLILRDHSGRIIYGAQKYPEGLSVSFEVDFPSEADFSRTEVYVSLGRPAFGLSPEAFAVCAKN